MNDDDDKRWATNQVCRLGGEWVTHLNGITFRLFYTIAIHNPTYAVDEEKKTLGSLSATYALHSPMLYRHMSDDYPHSPFRLSSRREAPTRRHPSVVTGLSVTSSPPPSSRCGSSLIISHSRRVE